VTISQTIPKVYSITTKLSMQQVQPCYVHVDQKTFKTPWLLWLIIKIDSEQSFINRALKHDPPRCLHVTYYTNFLFLQQKAFSQQDKPFIAANNEQS